MEWVIDNGALIIAGIGAIALAIVAVKRFISSDYETQLNNVREWLLWAVTEAEKALGEGTGKLKLRYVYDSFLVTFPWLSKAISFELFEALTNEAVDRMKELLHNNYKAKEYVEGEK